MGDSDTAADTSADSAPDSAADSVPLPDLDNDGYGAATDGGDDCNDADPAIHPGAAEDCEDAVDLDCDGDPWGSCSEVQPASDPYLVKVWPAVAVGYPIRDVTGDGIADLMLGGTNRLGVVVGGELGQDGSTPTLAHSWYEPDGRFEYQMFDAGDVDGDGFNDIVVDDPLDLQALAVEFGPIPVDGADTRLTADAAIWESPEGTYVEWGYHAAGGRDMDGNGGTDFVVERAIWTGTEYELYLDGFFGGGGRTPRLVSYRARVDERLSVSMVSDLDGDGLDDLLIARRHSVTDENVLWFSGAELSSNDGALLDDLVGGQFDASGTTHPAAIGLDWYSVGDWDGDGYQDVVGIDDLEWNGLYDQGSYAGSGYGRIAYYGRARPGANIADGNIRVDVELERVCGPGTPWMRDRDSSGGIFCFRQGTDSEHDTLDSFVIFPPTPIHGEVGFSDSQHFEVLSHTTTGIASSVPIGGPDLTGDGLGDVALMGDDGVYLFPGFELPWGDAAAW